VSTRAVRRLRGARVIMACAGLWLASACSQAWSVGTEQQARQDLKASDSIFPNIPLLTQEGRPVRFYDDLVRGKTVLINFIYTSCQKSCSPTTANLALVHGLLGDRVGRDLFLLSISLDPAVDRPKTLKEYATRFGQFQGWYFLTGNEREIEELRRKLGLYDLDPVLDADKTQHAGIVIVGNDSTNRWSSLPALMDPRQLAQTVLRITRNGRGG
jgi:protein SCO1/2